MAALAYNHERHEYRSGGQAIPGLTSVLGALGYYGTGAKYFTEKSRQLGKAVHRTCQAIDQFAPQAACLSEADIFSQPLHEDLAPYADGYLLFKKESGFSPVTWEKPMMSERLRIAGTPDCVGQCNGMVTIIDLKSWKNGGTKPKRSAEIQLAGYAVMVAEEKGIDVSQIQRWTVMLSGNGKYRLYRCDKVGDFGVVTCASVLYWDLVSAGLAKIVGDDPELTIGE